MNRLALPLTGLFLLIIGALVTAGGLEILNRCTQTAERFNLCY
jgi:hypothetical protein